MPLERAGRPDPRGWCPGVLRPMRSADGWLLRVRVPLGRLAPAQVRALAGLLQRRLASCWELTQRAQLQLRGIDDAALPEVQSTLTAFSLVDADAVAEARRNLVVQPFWSAGDRTERLARWLDQALARDGWPPLPDKFGFALDTGERPCLRGVPADVRIEGAGEGDALWVYPDGAQQAVRVLPAELPALLRALVQWFAAERARCPAVRRMRDAVARAPLPPAWCWQALPAAAMPTVPSGPTREGWVLGFPFGVVDVAAAQALAALGVGLRLTPWRAVLLEGCRARPAVPSAFDDPGHPLWRVAACVGAPHCASAAGPTRSVALALAPLLPPQRRLHVSGCAKGCAHAGAAVTVVVRPSGYDLVPHGRAEDPPQRQGLDLAALQDWMNEERGHAVSL